MYDVTSDKFNSTTAHARGRMNEAALCNIYTWNKDTRQCVKTTRMKKESWLYLCMTPLLTRLTRVQAVAMGALDYLSDLCDCNCNCVRENRQLRELKKHKQLQTVEIKVKMDCEGCERMVRKAVEGMKGVSQIMIEPKLNKLTVVGYVDPKKVLRRVSYRTGKRPIMWPYVPYDEIPHPYAPGVYDRKAPPGYVRNASENPQVSNLARASSTEVKYTTAFSDDNPNACIIM